MKEYVPNYRESMDIFARCHLEDSLESAIKNCDDKNKNYKFDNILEKNPYTEVSDLVKFLLSLNE